MDQIAIKITETEKQQYKNICNKNNETIKNNITEYIKNYTDYENDTKYINVAVDKNLKRLFKQRCTDTNNTMQEILYKHIKETIKRDQQCK